MSATANGGGPPNILLLTADDMDGDTPGCCGGLPNATPRIDTLAATGTVFRRAHVPVAVCQPSRSAIMTGRWPHRSGAEGFEPIRGDVPVLADLLRPAGYRFGILGKVEHLAPFERFGWDTAVGHADLGAGRDPRRYAEATSSFLAAAGERPWFLMANAHDPHRPFSGSDQEAETFGDDVRRRVPAPSRVFGGDEIDVPGFLPDLPEVRREVAEYQSSSRRCDDVVGAVLDALAAAGMRERTVVVFLSDNGMAFPFAKANCYLRSTRTPLVVSWPEVTVPGTVDKEHFVSALDLFPTLAAAAGVEPGAGIDGRSLVPVLRGEREPTRDAVVTVFHETAAKLRYEMRCIQDATHGYIWNAWSDGERRYHAENMSGRTWTAMEEAASRDPAVAARCEHHLLRRPQELYDLVADPACVADRSDDAAHADALARLRTRLVTWMADVDDPLGPTFSDFLVRGWTLPPVSG